MDKYKKLCAVFVVLVCTNFSARCEIDFFTYHDVCVLFMNGKTNPNTPVGIAYKQKNYSAGNIDAASQLIIKNLSSAISKSATIKELNINSHKYGKYAEAIKYFITNGEQGSFDSNAGINYNIMCSSSSYTSANCQGAKEMLQQKYSELPSALAKDSEIKDMMSQFYSQDTQVKTKSSCCNSCAIL